MVRDHQVTSARCGHELVVRSDELLRDVEVRVRRDRVLCDACNRRDYLALLAEREVEIARLGGGVAARFLVEANTHAIATTRGLRVVAA
jgi:hypothetical protein